MKFTLWIALGCVVGLAGCQSTTTSNPNQPQFLTQKIYHAPAQIFDFDLGSTVLRGELKLKQSCGVMGTSLDIQDQLGQQVRVDTFNLNNNPQLGSTIESSLQDISPALIQLYQSKYQATASAAQTGKSILGDVIFTRLEFAQQYVDVAIMKHYSYVYVLQWNSPLVQNNAEQAQQQLQILLKSLSIPGQKIKGTADDLPISFDLSHSDPKAQQTWQKTYCK